MKWGGQQLGRGIKVPHCKKKKRENQQSPYPDAFKTTGMCKIHIQVECVRMARVHMAHTLDLPPLLTIHIHANKTWLRWGHSTFEPIDLPPSHEIDQ